VLASFAPDTLDQEVDADYFDHDSLNLPALLPKTPSNQPHRFGNKVAEKKKTTPDEHLAARDQVTSIAPKPMVLRANYSYAPKPEYPAQARREGWEGTVLLAILVDAEGRPARITLSRSSGFASLDGAAQETVKHWRFQPARYDGKPVQSWVKVPIVFTLAGAKR
jgi:protein TonB